MSGGACTECTNEKGFSPAGASVRELVWTLRRYLSDLARGCKAGVAEALGARSRLFLQSDKPEPRR